MAPYGSAPIIFAMRNNIRCKTHHSFSVLPLQNKTCIGICSNTCFVLGSIQENGASYFSNALSCSRNSSAAALAMNCIAFLKQASSISKAEL